MGWSNIGSWSNTPKWSNAAPAWSNSGKTNPWSNVSPGVSWGNVPWSNQASGIIGAPGSGWSNVGGGGGGGGTTPTPTPVVSTPTPTVTVYDTKTGQSQQVSQKIADAMIAQGSVRYAPTPTSPTFAGGGVSEPIVSTPKILEPLITPIGYKTSPETAEQIAKMLKSPTAQFTEKSAQEAFKIVSEAGISLKGSDIQAKLVTSTPEQRAAEKKFYEKTGYTFADTEKPGFIPALAEVPMGDIPIVAPLFGKTEKEFGTLIGDIKKESKISTPETTIWREYTSEDAPLLFRAKSTLSELAANVQSFDVLKGSFEKGLDFLFPFQNKDDIQHQSDYLKAKYGVYEKALAVRESGSPIEYAKFMAESPVLQAEVGGYAIGGLIGGGSQLVRYGLSGAAKESSSMIGFVGSKAPSFIENISKSSKFLEYVTKTPSLIPKVLSGSEKLVEPGITLAGLGYVGYDISQSKTGGEALAKLSLLGVAAPYAKAGFEDVSKLSSRIRLMNVPKSTENVLNPKVEAGIETFPTTKAGSFGKFKEEFVTPEGELAGFHATSEGYGGSPIKVRALPESELRPHDVPGMYISPAEKGASTAFLRLPGEEMNIPSSPKSFIKSLLSSSALKPEIYDIRGIKDIERIPGGKNVRTSREFLYGNEKVPTPGVGYIEPKIELGEFRGEAQAVLARDTFLSKPIKTTKVRVKGHDIKVTERNIVDIPSSVSESTFKPGIAKTTSQKTKIEFSSRIEPTTPSRTLSSLGILSWLRTPEKEIQSKNIPDRTFVSSVITPLSIVSPISKQTSFVSTPTKIISSDVKKSSKLISSVAELISSTTDIPSRIEPSSKLISSVAKSPVYPRPWLDRYYNAGLDKEIPLDLPSLDYKEEGKRKKKQKGFQYTRKTRISPIFEGVEKIFEGTPVNPLGLPSKSVKKTSRTMQVKRSHIRPKKATPEINFGLDVGKIKNPLKTNKVKYSKVNKKKKNKQFWET